MIEAGRWRDTGNRPRSRVCAFTSPIRMRRRRGSNGNTNSLLRQYLPRSTDLSVFSQAELDAIAIRLNSRPRRALGFATPDEVFSGLVDKAANAVTARNAEGVRYET
jgi:hypothetical protein